MAGSNFKNDLKFMAKDLQSATHKYVDFKERAAHFMMAPSNAGDELNTASIFPGNDDSCLLPLDSAIPKMNPIKINNDIQKSKTKGQGQVNFDIKSPLTAFVQREKKFKRSLSGTYGKNYQQQEEESGR